MTLSSHLEVFLTPLALMMTLRFDERPIYHQQPHCDFKDVQGYTCYTYLIFREEFSHRSECYFFPNPPTKQIIEIEDCQI